MTTVSPDMHPDRTATRRGPANRDGEHHFGVIAQLRTSEFEGPSRAEQVAHQLETAIAVGLISNGERLPPERDLAVQLSVSVLHVRQALASLRERGLIETRRGRGGGSVVRDSCAVSQQEAERRLRERSGEQLRDLGDLESSVVAASARLAAARADETDVRRLHGLAQQISASSPLEDIRRADSRFHIGLAVAAQSPRLTTLTIQVQGELAPLLWAAPSRPVPLGDIIAEHAAIVEAIADGNEARAQSLAIAHSAHETELVIDAHLKLILASADQ